MIISKKTDIKDFLVTIQVEFIFTDSSLSMINEGKTRITYDSTNHTYRQFSFGSGWIDQEPAIIDNIYSYVWKHRKDINQQLRKEEG